MKKIIIYFFITLGCIALVFLFQSLTALLIGIVWNRVLCSIFSKLSFINFWQSYGIVWILTILGWFFKPNSKEKEG